MRTPLTPLMRRIRYGEPVVIVSGLPRSGTSMIMKMLAAGGVPLFTDHARSADEDNPEGYFEHELVKRLGETKDKSWVRGARGKALKVVSHLLKELPPDNFYRIVFARRDLKEVIASQNLMLERLGRANPVADREAEELYRKHLIHVTMYVEAQPNMALLTIQHRDALADPHRCAAEISRFLGWRLDLAPMAAAVNPRLYRNRVAQAVRPLSP